MPAQTTEIAASSLRALGLDPNRCQQAAALAGDGSDRRFFRLQLADGTTLIVVQPATGPQGRAEAAAARAIGKHLFACGVPVPRIHAFDEKSGLLLCEDLGDTLLQKAAAAAEPAGRRQLYYQAIAVLAHMQTMGAENFDPGWCWDTPVYDRRLMLDRESGYFSRAFCQQTLGMNQIPAAVSHEFEALADRAAREPAVFFLHRDFQSRNLMVHGGRIRVIDFQGGRLGPLAYDLASLLLDPYAALPPALQVELRQHYLDLLGEKMVVDKESFLRGYSALALQRTLQIIGAFAFLSGQKQKGFFRAFLRPALISLQEQLAMATGADYPALGELTSDCLARLDRLHHP